MNLHVTYFVILLFLPVPNWASVGMEVTIVIMDVRIEKINMFEIQTLNSISTLDSKAYFGSYKRITFEKAYL